MFLVGIFNAFELAFSFDDTLEVTDLFGLGASGFRTAVFFFLSVKAGV